MTFEFLDDSFHYLEPVEYPKPYRIPYKGSKQKICKRLLDFIIERHPDKKYFIDLFGGGGSVSFYALHCGFKKVFYNELSEDMCGLIKYILSDGCDINDYNSRWWKFVTREEFFKIKDGQPTTLEDRAYRYGILICYSFSQDLRSYAFSPEKEIIRHKMHNLVVFKDHDGVVFIKDYFKSNYNVQDKYLLFWDNFLEHIKDLNPIESRQVYTGFMIKFEGLSVTNGWQYFVGGFDDFFNSSQKSIVNLIKENCEGVEVKEYVSGNLQKLQRLKQLEKLGQLERLEQLEQLEQLRRLEKLEQLKGLKELKKLQQLEQLERLEKLQRLKELKKLQQLEQLGQLEQLEQLRRLQQLKKLQQLEKLNILNLDYKEALSLISKEIDLKDAIIYCDPPYVGTDIRGYVSNEFDSKGFYDWLSDYDKQGITIYFSEYNAPFEKIFEVKKRVMGRHEETKTGGGVEKLFINKRLQ